MKAIYFPYVLPVAAAVVTAQQSCTLTATLSAKTTATAKAVSTYCPECDQAKANGGVYTTRYDTTLLAVGPSGLVSSVYPVTNVLTGTTPVDSNTIPPGFVATALVCTACSPASTVVVTTPLGGSGSPSGGAPTAGAPASPSAVGGPGGSGTSAGSSGPGGLNAASSISGAPPAQYTGAAGSLKFSKELYRGGLVYFCLAAMHYVFE